MSLRESVQGEPADSGVAFVELSRVAGRRYWLIIYRPATHVEICRNWHVISFPEDNRVAMSRFSTMNVGDLAIVKSSGGPFTDLWEIDSAMQPNPFGDSEPWASQGDLQGRRFEHTRNIKLVEVFEPFFLSLRSVLGDKDYRSGLLPLTYEEFKILYPRSR